MESLTKELLVAIRKIIQSSNEHSCHLYSTPVLSSPQFALLSAIQNEPSWTLTELAQRLDLKIATAESILSGLEAINLVKRAHLQTDIHRQHQNLTEAGELKLNSTLWALHNGFIEEFESIDSAEREQIVAALQHVLVLMDRARRKND